MKQRYRNFVNAYNNFVDNPEVAMVASVFALAFSLTVFIIKCFR